MKVHCSDLKLIKSDIVNFIQNQSTTYQSRDDYKELLNLVLLFFGENPNEKLKEQALFSNFFLEWRPNIYYIVFNYYCDQFNNYGSNIIY